MAIAKLFIFVTTLAIIGGCHIKRNVVAGSAACVAIATTRINTIPGNSYNKIYIFTIPEPVRSLFCIPRCRTHSRGGIQQQATTTDHETRE